MTSHRCPIAGCPFEVPYSQLMCKGHWRLVPKPIQAEVYGTFRKRRGGPTHLAAMKRAIASVEATIAGWAKQKAEAETDEPERVVTLPYKDD